jgi:hypothetical protein
LEKPPTAAPTTIRKGAMQEQMEKEIRGKEAKIVELKNEMDKQVGDREARIAELQEQLASVESKCRDLQFRNEEEKKAFVQQRNAFDQEKPRIYSRGKKDAETEHEEENGLRLYKRNSVPERRFLVRHKFANVSSNKLLVRRAGAN